MIKRNTIILNIYFLLQPITSILSIFLTSYISQYLIIVILIILTLLNNKGRINKDFILIFVVSLTFLLLNVLFSKKTSYVLPDIVNFIVFSIVPLYLFYSQKLDFKYLTNLFFKNAVILTLLMPYFYYLLQNNFINYFDMGIVCHIAVLSSAVYLVNYKKNKILNIVLQLVNLIIGLVFGSRTVITASLVVIVLSIILLNRKKKILHWITIIGIFLIIIYIVNNLESLLVFISNTLESNNINSRNINLFLLQIQSDSMVDVLSGRNEIYPFVIEFLSKNPILPNGFGMARILTNGVYYHSHNFFLEIFLILGIPLGTAFLIMFIIQYLILFKKDKFTSTFILMVTASFIIRGTFGTHFITDPFFLISMGYLLSFANAKSDSIIYEKIKSI